MDRRRKIIMKWVIGLVCIAALFAFFAAMPMLAGVDSQKDEIEASILSGTVTTGSVNCEVVGGGLLSQEKTVDVSVPAAVKLTEYLVLDGDVVKAGDPIASVDRLTVLDTIAQVQKTLDSLAVQIEKAADASNEASVTALTGGTVKLVHAQKGDSVEKVMLEHGALAVVSLDDIMAVDVRTDSDLRVGKPVTVTFSDGKSVAGKVVKNLSGTMTVTIADQSYAVGEGVEIESEYGVYLGYGELYVYSPWNATAYAGTVSDVNIRVGDKVSVGKTLMTLDGAGYSAAYRQLVNQRQIYEDLMQSLFQMYQSETVTAPCDGVVTDMDRNLLHQFSYSAQQPSGELYSLDMTQVAQVTPQATMMLNIAVDELDVMALQEGMRAQVKIDALGSEKHEAVITAIGNMGIDNGGSSKYTVQLTMDRTEGMLSGMSGVATIVLSTAENVLTVPAKALVEAGNQTLVYTDYNEKRNELLNPVAVTVGASDGETVEILEGLKEGQTYYYAYYDKLVISATPDFVDNRSIFG